MNEHTHDVRDLNADVAAKQHEHDIHDLRDVAAKYHSHTVHDLPQTPTMQEFGRLADRVSDLESQLEAMQERAEAEAAVGAAVADGNATIERIADAIERRARQLIPESEDAAILAALSHDPDIRVGVQLLALAAEIRKP